MSGTRLRGREAEARRNDARVLDAALEVYARDPKAPMSAVARRAGVGQASLYRRYRSKEELLARVCEDGMLRMRDAAVQAQAGDPHDAVAGFARWYLESGTPQLSSLLGSFEPEDALFALAHETNEAIQALVDRAIAAGRLRADVTGADLTLIVTQLSGLEAGDAARSRELRQRYVTLILDGLALAGSEPLPGPAPDADELERPWRAAGRAGRPADLAPHQHVVTRR